MYCNKCQQEIDVEKWKYCPHCGDGLIDEKIFYFLKKIFFSKRNLVIFIITILLFAGLSIFWIINSERKISEKNKQIEQLLAEKKAVKVEAEFPQKIMPIAYALDGQKLATLKVNSPIYGKLRAELEVPGISNPYSENIDVRPESKMYYLGPDISKEGYANLLDSKNANLSLKVFLMKEDGSEQQLLAENKEVFFYSLKDMLWTDDGRDNSKYVVRLIDKDKEEIKNLVRKAADHMKELGGTGDAMVGTQGDQAEIRRQMEAIFLAMSKDYQIRYVMAPFSYDSAAAQKIKTPDEVIRTKSGLCVELSLLMAAALENIGLNPVIVLTADHAWAGVQLESKTDKYVFIETTALEKSPQEAMQIAQKNWEKIKKTDGFRLLNVNELRADGYLPMKY